LKTVVIGHHPYLKRRYDFFGIIIETVFKIQTFEEYSELSNKGSA